MSAKDTVRRNKTVIQLTLSTDRRLILNKVYEEKLITSREYNNLKSIDKVDEEGHVVELVDKIMNKGEDTCRAFLTLLQTDEDIKVTYPELKNIQLNDTSLLPKPVQVTSPGNIQLNDTSLLPKPVQVTCPDDLSKECKRQKKSEQYQLNSQPTGLCVIINNERFMNGNDRNGTNKDARCLAEVFSWLGFRVLMCKDQTADQMDRALKCFASLSDPSQLQEFSVKEWSGSEYTDLREAPKHGDAFICCVLSHGEKGVVLGIDSKPLCIKQIMRTFKATDQSELTGKPKVFLIQSCQGRKRQPGVLLKDLQSDDSHSPYIPEEADFLVAIATVEDYVSIRHKIDGSWFVQSLCQQLEEGCRRGDDICSVLHRVNDDVSQKEGSVQPGAVKQMPEVRFTLRKQLVLSPHHN